MILGDFQFNLKALSPNSVTRTTDYNWSDSERIGDIPNLQNLGISRDQIEIEGVFYPKLSGKSIDEIRNSSLVKTANNLITDNGKILGKFVIVSIKENQSYFDKNGKPQKVEFSMTLKRSPEQVSATSLIKNDSIIDAVTKLARTYLRW